MVVDFDGPAAVCVSRAVDRALVQSARYQLDLAIDRAGLEQTALTSQVLFVDFDGARVEASISVVHRAKSTSRPGGLRARVGPRPGGRR